MIIYFARRDMQILGHATTNLPDGFVITEDLKTEEIETGVATFSCKIGFTEKNRALLEEMTEAGNYLLRSHENENEFYTIIETEIDTKNQDIYVYAEDAGLDLLNEIAPKFENETAYTAEWYINKYIVDSGFEIGVNEIPASSKRTLSWTGEETVTARLVSIANSFDGYEVSFSFDIKGLEITNKYVNIHKERGKELGEHLRLNRDIDRIVTTKSVANLATAFVCEGGTPEKAKDAKEDPPPITLKGYKYDDGDFYVDGDRLKARTANTRWSRYIWNKEPNRLNDGEGYIVRPFSYDTLSQKELCEHALTELKKACEMEVNYQIDIKKLPEGVKIGDRINIVDDAGELYISSRILKLETSVVDDNYTATIGEHLIKTSGISQKVIELAEQFAKTSQSAARALSVANNAKTAADEALTQANEVVEDVEKAQQSANTAAQSAADALQSATEAKTAADEAKNAVDTVEKSVENLETTVTDAQAAADNAQQAAATAQSKATEAEHAAAQAQADAADAKAAVVVAEGKADTAIANAETAQETAEIAKTEADTAKATAEAAKLDAKKAEEDIASLGERLTTVTTTMEANYARKTDLTESEAHLQSQISQNAGLISSTVSMLSVIDETANNAQDQAEKAQKRAEEARRQADQATADALAAQNAADEAARAAVSAKAEADTAQAAADVAQGVVDQAEADLATAKADLEEVLSRTDATEAEIAAAQNAVNTAQAAADKAKADASVAIQNATEAQKTADEAMQNATEAQAVANTAAQYAKIAQSVASESENATAAQEKADEAATIAAQAKETADTAVTNAANAQAKADQAVADAIKAENEAKAAAQSVATAQANLNTAKQNLADILANASATEAEIAEAQEALEAAQVAADEAMQNAAAANGAAELAAELAAVAQGRADEAQAKADEAQKAADDAQTAANEAKAAAESLAVRVTKAETDIVQNAEKIELRATKEEVATTYDKANSKGEQLIANGNGILGDNTNFSGFKFDGAETNNSPGSFVTTKGYYKDTTIDDFIPISVAKNYTLSFDAKSLNSVAPLYSYINMYDVDKLQIKAADYLYVSGTLTTLAQDLKDGDTIVYLTDVSKWVTNVTYANRISFWNYTNSFGYTYPPETYTKNNAALVSTSYKPATGCIDYTNNTVTLSSPWSRGTMAAGTQVSQGRTGTSYCYIGAINNKPPTDWATYTGYVAGGVNYSGVEVTTTKKKFFPATAYAKIGFIYNSGWLSDQLWVTNVTFSDTTTTDALESRVTTTETKITQNSSAIELRATKTELTQAVDDMSNNIGAVGAVSDDVNSRLLQAEATIKILSEAITQMVRKNGDSSVMIQEEGSATWYFDVGNIEDNAAANAEAIGTLQTEANENKSELEKLKGQVAGYEQRFSVSVYEDEPCIILHETDSDRVQIITNTRRIFARKVETTVDVVTTVQEADLSANNAITFDPLSKWTITTSLATDGIILHLEDGSNWYSFGAVEITGSAKYVKVEYLNGVVTQYFYNDASMTDLNSSYTDEQTLSSLVGVGCWEDIHIKVETTKAEISDVNYVDLTVSDYETLRSKKAEFEESVKVGGGWVWQTRNNGKNFGLAWKGVDG